MRAGPGSPGCAWASGWLPAGSCGWAPALDRSGELGTREGTQTSYHPGVAGSGFRCGVLGAHGEGTLAPDFFTFDRHTGSPQSAVELVTATSRTLQKSAPHLGGSRRFHLGLLRRPLLSATRAYWLATVWLPVSRQGKREKKVMVVKLKANCFRS